MNEQGIRDRNKLSTSISSQLDSAIQLSAATVIRTFADAGRRNPEWIKEAASIITINLMPVVHEIAGIPKNLRRFILGQTILVSRRSSDRSYESFKPWRHGSITAVGDNCLRVRTVGWWRPVRWIRTDHPLWSVTAVDE